MKPEMAVGRQALLCVVLVAVIILGAIIGVALISADDETPEQRALSACTHVFTAAKEVANGTRSHASFLELVGSEEVRAREAVREAPKFQPIAEAIVNLRNSRQATMTHDLEVLYRACG